AQCAADFEAEVRDVAHHRENALEGLARGNLAPGRSHAEPRGTFGASAASGGENVSGVHQVLAREAGLVMGALRAIGAIFRACARLDRSKRQSWTSSRR